MVWQGTPMAKSGGKYLITKKKTFEDMGTISLANTKLAFDFAYAMAYGEKHRKRRSGGLETRKPTQVFANAFSGKVCEFAVYQHFTSHQIPMKEPDLAIYDRGKWDNFDFKLALKNNQSFDINVKSTQHYGNLLLLEQADWGRDGVYLPDDKVYHAFILVRQNLGLEKLLKAQKTLYSYYLTKEALSQVVFSQAIQYDFAGVISTDCLAQVIASQQIIKQGEFLGSQAQKMDASNYYVQAGDMLKISQLMAYLKRHV